MSSAKDFYWALKNSNDMIGVYLATQPSHIPPEVQNIMQVPDPLNPVVTRYATAVRVIGYRVAPFFNINALIVHFIDKFGVVYNDIGTQFMVVPMPGNECYIDPLEKPASVYQFGGKVPEYKAWTMHENNFDRTQSLYLQVQANACGRVNVASVAAKALPKKDYPHRCLLCGAPAYIGFFKTDCSSATCKNHQKTS